MSKAASTYQDSLSDLGYGIPLWRPEPSPDPVEIGDVGFIDPMFGSWCRLFNILQPAEGQTVPDDFVPLDFSSGRVNTLARRIVPGVYTTSQSIKEEHGVPKDSPLSNLIDSVVQYECTTDSGALLALQDAAVGQYASPTWSWSSYISEHHSSWYRWAVQQRRLAIRQEDIIVIHGCTKAHNWLLAAFMGKGQVMRLSFKANKPFQELGAALKQDQLIVSPELRMSASFHALRKSEAMSESQPTDSEAQAPSPTDCIFLSAFRVRTRGWWRKVKAAADPKDLSGDDSSDDESVNYISRTRSGDGGEEEEEGVRLVHLPERNKITKSPADRILDYLLTSTGVDVAIAPDSFIDPRSGLPVNINNLTDAELKRYFPSTLTGNGAATLDFDEMLRLRKYDARAGGHDRRVIDDALLHGYIDDISHKSMISISV